MRRVIHECDRCGKSSEARTDAGPVIGDDEPAGWYMAKVSATGSRTVSQTSYLWCPPCHRAVTEKLSPEGSRI